MTAHRPLPLPAVFEPKNAEKYEYAPDQQRLFADAAEWRAPTASPRPPPTSRTSTCCSSTCRRTSASREGSLYVGGRSGRGAIDDSRRIAEFVYRNLNALTNITTTMDTHFAYQIFFPSFWVDQDDQPLTPYREITTDDIDRGEVRPNPAVAQLALQRQLPVAAQAGALLLRGAREGRQVQASTSGRPTASWAATVTPWSASSTRRACSTPSRAARSRGSR